MIIYCKIVFGASTSVMTDYYFEDISDQGGITPIADSVMCMTVTVNFAT